MRILVTYFSQTGNTKRIAEVIHEITSQDNDSTLKDFKNLKVSELNDYDLVFLGSACHHSNLAPPVLKFIKKIPESPTFKLAGFITHSTYPPEGSERYTELFERWAGKCEKTFEKLQNENKIDYKGFFRCMGKPSKPIERFIHAKIITEDEEWEEYIKKVIKHPDEIDIKNAKEFAREILNKF